MVVHTVISCLYSCRHTKCCRSDRLYILSRWVRLPECRQSQQQLCLLPRNLLRLEGNGVHQVSARKILPRYKVSVMLIEMVLFLESSSSLQWSSCVRADSVMDLHTTVPGFKTWWVRYTFFWASDWLPQYQHQKVERLLVCAEGRGRISRSDLTQGINMGSYVFQWRFTSMDSKMTGRPRVCILWRAGVSCPVSASLHSCVKAHWSKYHCYKQAPSRYDLRCLKAMLKPQLTTTNIITV